MKNTRQIFALLLLSFSSFLISIDAQQFRVVRYDENHGLPQPYIYTLGQSGTGELWIGTGAGLATFNGKEFVTYTDADSLADNFISCSHLHDRIAWFGHMNGGVTRYNGKIFEKILEGDHGLGAISDIKGSGSTHWASSQSGGLWRIESGKRPQPYLDAENSISIFAFELLSSTECVIGSIDGAYIYSINSESESLRLISKLDGIPETKIQDLTISSDGNTLYILTQDEGIYTYNTRQYSMTTAPLGYDFEAGIEGPQQVFEDRNQNLWIPTFGSGLFKMIRDENGLYSSWVNYNEENGLPGNNVKHVSQDREDNIWIGLFGTGLARLIDQEYTFYPLDDEESGNNVFSIFSSEQYRWFGTGRGVVRMDRVSGDRLFLGGNDAGLPDQNIMAIAGFQEGDLWVGTESNGIYRWDESRRRFARFFISPGALENSINAMEISEGMLWVATGKGVCRVDTRTNEISWFTLQNAGLPHNTVNDLQVDLSGRVWLSTLSNTVSYIENDSVTRMIIPMVGAALNIRSIALDGNGNIWVGTDGNGVLKMAGDTAVNYTAADGLISDYCYSLVGDDRNYIWVSHRGGLSRIRLSDEKISTVKEEVGIGRSMAFNVNAVFKDSEGIIWFGSSQGVLSYDPRMAKGTAPAPALSISSILVDNKPVEVSQVINLPIGRHDIRIQFVGVNLKNPEAVRYQYKMEGLGNSWSEEFTEPQVPFTALPDGKYTFLVRAINGEGTVNELPVSIQFIIARPLWKRLWFYALIITLITILVVGYIKRREYTLRMERDALEKAVQERTEEVVKQKEEIESQRDAIKSQSDEINLINKNLTDSITYASRIQRAVFPLPEQLTALYPDSFIMNRPQYIVSGDFFWVARQNELKVVTVSDCTGHGVPGAFMSMLGITLLNELVNNMGISQPQLVLNLLKNEIIHALRQEEGKESAADGMDMALCIYDPASSILQYAGGFNPLILIRNGEMMQYKADPMPIGIGAIKGKDFTKHEVKIEKGDVIYLYSDGYEDQFGGEHDKKFSRKRFRELLLQIHALPMVEQKKTLEVTLDQWMDGREQIDDITVMGIRF